MPKRTRFSKKALVERKKRFPEITDQQLWIWDQNDGFRNIPRTMSIILSIINDMSKNTPAGQVYLGLWCHCFDEMYLSLAKSKELAALAGYTGERAVRSWSDRMKQLETLGLIKVAPGTSGELSFAVILNPHQVIQKLYEGGHSGIMQTKYYALVERAREIGSDDFEPDEVDEEPVTPAPKGAAAYGKLT